MISGKLVIPYENGREATAEAMKWGDASQVVYKKDTIEMVIKLSPQYFEPFIVALEHLCGDDFTFDAQLNPPLFVADIGGKKGERVAAKRARSVAKKTEAAAEAAKEAEAAATGVVLPPKRPDMPGRQPQTDMTKEEMEEQRKKVELRQVTNDTQKQIDAQFK